MAKMRKCPRCKLPQERTIAVCQYCGIDIEWELEGIKFKSSGHFKKIIFITILIAGFILIFSLVSTILEGIIIYTMFGVAALIAYASIGENNEGQAEISDEIEDSDVDQIFTEGDRVGYVYILINASYQKNTLKIGRTKRHPEERARELSAATGVPSEFIVAYSRIVTDDEKAESLIHQRLKKYRTTDTRKDRNREFFMLPLEKAIETVNAVVQEVGEPSL